MVGVFVANGDAFTCLWNSCDNIFKSVNGGDIFWNECGNTAVTACVWHTGSNDEQVCSHGADTIKHAVFCSITDGKHGDNRGDADDNSKKCEQSSNKVHSQCIECTIR